MLGDDYAVCAETLRASYDCAEIVWIGDAVEKDDEQRLFFALGKVQDVVNVTIFKVGNGGDDALVIAAVCKFVKHVFVNVTRDRARFFCKFVHLREHGIELSFLQEKFVYCFACSIGFFDGVATVDVHILPFLLALCERGLRRFCWFSAFRNGKNHLLMLSSKHIDKNSSRRAVLPTRYRYPSTASKPLARLYSLISACFALVCTLQLRARRKTSCSSSSKSGSNFSASAACETALTTLMTSWCSAPVFCVEPMVTLVRVYKDKSKSHRMQGKRVLLAYWSCQRKYRIVVHKLNFSITARVWQQLAGFKHIDII